MRILLYSYNYYPEPIGIAPLMTELAEGLVKRGHEVRVITAMPWYPKCEISPASYQGKIYLTEERNGVKIQRCYVRIRQERGLINRVLFELSFASLSFWQALWGWRPDVILLTVPGLPVCVPAALIGWIYRQPVVLNLQDILPDAAIGVGLITNPNLIRVFRGLEKFAYWMSTKIAVITDGFTENLVQKGVPAEKIVEIENWVDVKFIRPIDEQPNQFRQEHQLDGKFVVLYSGNIALTQPLEVLIDAAAQLIALENLAVVIVGEEHALQRLKQYRDRQQAINVTLLPFQPRSRLPEMLSAADVGIVMQKRNVVDFNKPSKIPLLLASGCAIIGSVPASGTAARAIARSGGGVVIPPEDVAALAEAIAHLQAHPEEVKRLGAQGRSHAETYYKFENSLDQYEKLFLQVQK